MLVFFSGPFDAFGCMSTKSAKAFVHGSFVCLRRIQQSSTVYDSLHVVSSFDLPYLGFNPLRHIDCKIEDDGTHQSSTNQISQAVFLEGEDEEAFNRIVSEAGTQVLYDYYNHYSIYLNMFYRYLPDFPRSSMNIHTTPVSTIVQSAFRMIARVVWGDGLQSNCRILIR